MVEEETKEFPTEELIEGASLRDESSGLSCTLQSRCIPADRLLNLCGMGFEYLKGKGKKSLGNPTGVG